MLSNHYAIRYLNHGRYKSFYIYSEAMNNAEAWHWATVDAGVRQIPKYRRDQIPKLSKPQAELLGITDVEWSVA
jgi:hypothetical protein